MVELTPRKANGRMDYVAYIRTSWPIAVFILGVVFWMTERLESPDQKRHRIELIVHPVIEDIRELRSHIVRHEQTGGHSRMESRMGAIEAKVEAIEKTLNRLNP